MLRVIRNHRRAAYNAAPAEYENLSVYPVGIDARVCPADLLAAARAECDRMIEAEGLIVAPGFVDMMGQSASSFLDNPASAASLLSQGITTINCGEGVSAAPATDGQR